MKINRDSPAMRYGCAAILVALAIALRLLLDPVLGGGYAFITLFLAILLTAWYGGFGPAIAAVVLGALAASYFVLAPRGSFSLVGRDERVALVLYLCIGVGIAMIAGSMHAARKRAELAADVAQRRAELIDQTYDALLVWDLHGTITFWNRGAERLYGIRREDALGQVCHEFLQTKVDGGVVAMISALQRDGSWEGELEHTNGDQRRIIVESRITLVQDGAQTYVVEANRDITSVRESEARLRTVTNTARVGLVIVDEKHCYRYANRAYAEILNLPENNLVGLRMADVLAPVYETQIRRRLEQAFQGERVSYGLQLPPIAPGAENRHYAVSYEPGVDRSGKIVVVVVADISALKAAELKLRESLQETVNLKAALNEHAIVAITDKQGRITEVNEKFCEISKYSREELLGQDHRIINSGAHSKEFFRNLWQTIGQGKVWQGDIKNKAKDGSFYWVATTIVPFLDPDGKPRQYVAIRADITERKLAEEARARLSGIVRSSSDAIIGKSLDGIITSWNSGAEKIFGYSEAEAVGQPMRMLFPAELANDEVDILARVARDETAPHFEAQRVRKDGVTIDVSMTISPVEDSEGRIIGASTIARDITERKRAEHTAVLLAAIVDSSFDAIVGKDLQGIVTSWNAGAERMFGYTAGEIIGNSITRLIPPACHGEESRILARIKSGEGVAPFDTIRVRKDGSLVDVSVTVSPIRNAAGEVIGASKVARDVTDQKKAAKALRESEERLHTVTENLTEGLIVSDIDGQLLHWNRASLEMHGFRNLEEGLRMMPEFAEIFDLRTLDGISMSVDRWPLARVLRGERLRDAEVRIHRRGRDWSRVFNYSGNIVHDASGKPLAFVAMSDITERKQAEDELASSQAQLQAIFDNITEGICVIDPENDVVNMNPACRRLVGLSEPGMSRTDMIPLVEILSPNGEIVPQEDWPGHRALRGDFVQNYELVMRQKVSGRASSLEYNTAPIRDKTGKARQVIVSFRDVTERRQTEARYRTLFDYAPDGILIADPKSYYLDANASICRMLGYTRDELIGLHASNIVAPVEIPHIESALRVLTVKTDYQREWQFRRKDGSVFPAEVIATMMPDGNLMAMIRDVTERNNAALALRDKDAQIHAADRRLAEIVQGMTEACFALDTEWRFTFVNDRGESLLRHQRGEMLGRTIWEVFSKLGGTPMEANYRRAMTERVPVAFEVFSPIAERWLDIRLFPTAEGLAAFLLDIHGRKLVETALRESEDQFRTMANSIPQLAWMAHADGFMFWYNQRWHDYTGTTPEQMEGWGWKSVHDPDVLPKVLEGWQGAVASGQPFEMEFPLRGADGRFRMFLTRVEPVKDSQGRVVQWFGTNTDVDELKRMEVSLRDTQARLNSTLAAGSIGTWTWDIVHDRLVADVFTARMFSIEADAAAKGLPAEAYLRAVMEEDQPGVADGLARAIQSCGYYDIEYRVRQREGGLRWLQAKGRVEGDEAGNALNFHGAVIDITERKLADGILREAEKEKQLAYEASRLKSEFLANMSHELRTPLNCIIGFTEFLVDEKPGPLNPKQKEYLTDVHTSSRHLLQLINDVLDLAKVESGKIELYLETFSLAKAIEEVCAVVKGIAQKKSVHLQWTVTPELGLITLDQQKFKQVCYNLLSNAVKFTDAGGSVKIDALAHGGERFEVRVKDTGIGIRQEDMHRLFREFEQLESGSSRRFEGTGLGLALTKKLVESQGGSIGVESEYGTGSTFFALMPKAIAEVKSRE